MHARRFKFAGKNNEYAQSQYQIIFTNNSFDFTSNHNPIQDEQL